MNIMPRSPEFSGAAYFVTSHPERKAAIVDLDDPMNSLLVKHPKNKL